MNLDNKQRNFFDDGRTYRTDYRQLLVVIPSNDIRTVTKVIKDYLKFLENYESSILKYEKFKVNMGVLRYPVVTTEKDLQKLLRFLNIALDKAKEIEKKNLYSSSSVIMKMSSLSNTL